MKNIYLTDFQIKRLEPVSDNMDSYSGTRGKCLKYKDGVLKVFYDINVPTIKSIQKNVLKDSPIIIYPEKKLYKILSFSMPFIPEGYYMKKAPGKNLLTLRNEIICDKNDILFDDIEEIYYDKFLPLLKMEKDRISDLKFAHVFLDDNFYITDTDGFEPEDNAYKHNIDSFNEILSCLFRQIGDAPYFEYGILYSDESYLEKQINHIKKLTSNSVNSFKDFKDYFK